MNGYDPLTRQYIDTLKAEPADEYFIVGEWFSNAIVFGVLTGKKAYDVEGWGRGAKYTATPEFADWLKKQGLPSYGKHDRKEDNLSS